MEPRHQHPVGFIPTNLEHQNLVMETVAIMEATPFRVDIRDSRLHSHWGRGPRKHSSGIGLLWWLHRRWESSHCYWHYPASDGIPSMAHGSAPLTSRTRWEVSEYPSRGVWARRLHQPGNDREMYLWGQFQSSTLVY